MTTYGYGYYNFYQQNDEAKRLIYNGVLYIERELKDDVLTMNLNNESEVFIG